MILNSEQIDFLNKHTNGTWELNPEDLVDIRGDFDCSGQRLTDFKGIRFGRVSGEFLCYYNDLTTLKGGPQEVGGNFWSQINNLTTLKGSPQKVGGDFWCQLNNLTSLEGIPQEVGGNFGCYSNDLTTLKGVPREVGGNFWCYDNKLTTLEGAPQTIGGKFNSDHIDVPTGKWSLQTLIEMYRELSGRKKEMLGTLVSTESLQKKIDANPERAAVELKSIASLPEFKGLRWPKDLRSEVDLLADLDGVGL